MKGAPHAQGSRTRIAHRRHNDYVMRGFLYRLDFCRDLGLLAVAGFGHGAHRLNGFVSGALRLSGFHARRLITKKHNLIPKRYLTLSLIAL